MRVGYFADGPWSHTAIEKIVESDYLEIVFIVPDSTDKTQFKRVGREISVPYIPSENVNAKEFIDRISRYEADILISMSFNQILKADIINHSLWDSLIVTWGPPFYRRNPLNWADKW